MQENRYWKRKAIAFLLIFILAVSAAAVPFSVLAEDTVQTSTEAETQEAETKTAEKETKAAEKETNSKKPVRKLLKAANGNRYYYVDGKRDKTFTGIFRYKEKTWLIKKGKWNSGYTGFYKKNGKYYYFKKGLCNESYSGLQKYKNNYYLLKKGVWNKTATTVIRVKEKSTWYYVRKGVVDKTKNGIVKSGSRLFYLKNGKPDSKKSGLFKKKGKWYYFKKGVQDKKFKGLVKQGKDWLYIENGAFDKTFNGRASIKGYPNKFKVKNGKVKEGFVPPSPKLAKEAEKVLKKTGRSLKKAFQWAASSSYRLYDRSGDLGLAHYAKHGFKNHYGNCYVMAAIFCVLARELGYEAYQVSGAVNALAGGTTPHSWVEVKVDGTWYVCDPDMTKESGINGYLRSYGEAGTWHYYSPTRMGN